MVRAVRASRAAPLSGAPDRLRRGDRRRDRQLPAQRAAVLHRPARRRAGAAGLRRPAAVRGRRRARGRGRALLASRRRRAGPAAEPVRVSRRAGRADGDAPAVPDHRDSALPWYAVHGNHDNMLQGTVPAEGWLRDFPVGAVKYVTPPDDIDAAEALRRFETSDPAALAELAGAAEARGDARPCPRAGDPRVPRPRALPHVGPSGRARLHPAQRRRGHRLLRLRPRHRAVPRAGHGEPARRLAGLDRRRAARLARGRADRVRRPAGAAVQPPSAGDAGQRPAPARRRPPRAGRRAARPAARPPVRGRLGERAHPRARGHRDPRRRIPGRVLAGDHRVAHRLAAAGQDHRAARDRPRPGDRVHRDRQRGPGQLRRRREPRRPGQPGGAGPRARRQRLAGPGADHGRRRRGRRHRGGPERRARGRVAAASPVTRRSRGPAGTARAAGARRSGRRSGRAGWSRRR